MMTWRDPLYILKHIVFYKNDFQIKWNGKHLTFYFIVFIKKKNTNNYFAKDHSIFLTYWIKKIEQYS